MVKVVLRLLPTEPLGEDRSPDERLVRQAQEGNAQAFASLFALHRVAVKRFLVDLLVDRELAQDALQETFVRAQVALLRLGDRHRFRAWIFGVARNVAFECRREWKFETFDGDGALPDAIIPSPDPETVALGKEVDRHFTAALAQLAPHRRAALLMRVDHGLTYDEISVATGWTLQTVKNEIHRARLALRVAMSPYLRGDL